MLEYPVGGTELAGVSRRDLTPVPEISKDAVRVMTMWFGARDSAGGDLDTFDFEMLARGAFKPAVEFAIPDTYRLKGGPYPAFAQVDLDIRRELIKMENSPLAVFIVATASSAESSWMNDLTKGLLTLRTQQGKGQATFIYKVILGEGFSKEGEEDTSGYFSRNEKRAHELDGIYIPYVHDNRSLGIRRTIEFMNRVLGHDLPGEKFPNYTKEEFRKISWSLNREDFNLWSPRAGAIPKYQIVDGRPQFPF